MIKGRITAGGKSFLLIGLSRLNWEQLLEGRPIPIDAAELGEFGLPDGMGVIVMGGETEAAMSEKLGGMALQPEVAGQRFLLKGKLP